MSIPLVHGRYSSRCVTFKLSGLLEVMTTVIYSYNVEIFWASSNLTVPLDQASPAAFCCGGQGTLLLWYINGDLVVSSRKPIYQDKGFTFEQEVHNNGTIVNTLTIPAAMEKNNTRLRCHATGNPGPATSETFTLTVAGIINTAILTCNRKIIE